MRIGILGGGQLSQMLALSGIPLGIEFDFYFPNKAHSLNQLGKVHCAEYDDFHSLQSFANQVDVITYENENISIETLEFLSKTNKVYPDKHALRISQDRLFEKNMFKELEIPTNKHIEINTIDELSIAAQKLGYPFLLKKRTQGYDGKGQFIIKHPSDLSKVNTAQCINTIAEEFVSFDREVSIIAARNISSQVVFYDICENTHKNGILLKTINRSNDPIFALAQVYLEKIMLSLNYVGVLALEFFQVGNQLIANEMAPRVHNSGHWTISACMTSQFENHLRSILDFPLGDTTSLGKACMYNILGDMPEIRKLLHFKGLSFHDYKKSPQKGRKLGHITVLNQEQGFNAIELDKMLMRQTY